SGIGVILDWVPAHFPKDAHGLYEFDGAPLYEYQGEDRMENRGWGTRCFDVGRNEVQSFLISNAMFWLREYHADGLRVDAVASMLYLDYDKQPGEWLPNAYGGKECLEAIAFFRKLGDVIRAEFPDALFIAEESTAWPKVSKPAGEDGLGFNMKWNMGWMNDVLDYFATDPLFRKYKHDKLTFSMMYAFSENYILPISHDEVVHGKRSLLDRMPGEYEQKFAGLRAFLAYMMTHPGKKLLFMGSEIGQFTEWNYKGSVEWFLLDYDMHANTQRYVSALNHFYLEHSELWEIDGSWDGFSWVECDNRDESIISYIRRNKAGKELTVVLNLTPVARPAYPIGVSGPGVYTEVFNSDDKAFGGSGERNEGLIKAQKEQRGEYSYAIRLNLPPMSAVIFKRTRVPAKSTKTKPKAKK
ncbi:MAG: 1,4-alpha-glucan branching protein GlgB, partial [Eubacteriales bacterium]